MIKTWEKKIHGRFSTKVTKNREILEVLYDCERIVSYIIEEKKTRGGECGSDFGVTHTEYYRRETYLELTKNQERVL